MDRDRDAQLGGAVAHRAQQAGSARVRRVWREAADDARPEGVRPGGIAQVVEVLGDLFGMQREEFPVVDAAKPRGTCRGDLGSAVRDVANHGDAGEQRLLRADDARCRVVGDLPRLHRKHEPRQPFVEGRGGHDARQRGERQMRVRVHESGRHGAAAEVVALDVDSDRGFELCSRTNSQDAVAGDEHGAVADRRRRDR